MGLKATTVRVRVRPSFRREGRGRGRAAAEFAGLELETEAAVCPLSTGRDRRGVVGEGGDSGTDRYGCTQFNLKGRI